MTVRKKPGSDQTWEPGCVRMLTAEFAIDTVARRQVTRSRRQTAGCRTTDNAYFLKRIIRKNCRLSPISTYYSKVAVSHTLQHQVYLVTYFSHSRGAASQ